MALRPSRVAGVVAGCAVLVGIAAPASAQIALVAPGGDRVAVEGSAPTWATPGAKVGGVDDGEQRRVLVALALRDPRGAEALASAVSDPDSPQYRKFLDNKAFTERFAARPATVDKVTSWLRSQGLTVEGVSDNRAFVQVTGEVGRLRAAFGVTLAKFRTTLRDGRTVTLTAPEQQVSLPRGLRGAVDAVLGLDDAAKTITTQQIARTAPADRNARGAARPGDVAAAGEEDEWCALHWAETNNSTVPQKHPAGRQSNFLCGYDTPQMRAIYGLGGGNTGAGQTVAIVGAYNLATIESDTNQAAAQYGSPALTPGQYSAVLPPAYDNHDQCNPEAWASEQALDVQAVHTLAPASKIVYYGASSCFDLYNALNRAVVENKASIISNSWLYPGERLVPAAEREQMGRIAIQAAIQGQSIVFCSGDTGDNSGVQGQAEATFPASHPWVTAAGGTSVALGGDNKIAFTAGWANSGYTQSGGSWVAQSDDDGPFAGGAGGGVSMFYKAPAYQQGVVPTQLAGGKRAIPDVSALADSFTGMAIAYTNSHGQFVQMASGGTSLAAPLIAALVADAAQAQGVTRFGFLNDALYDLIGSPQITDVKPVSAGIWSPFMHTFGGVHVPDGLGSYLLDVDSRPQSLQSGQGWDTLTGIGTPTAGFVTALGK
ncbi:Pseudomonalisin (plasmid) [Actinosynnema sp. ALI-1.44]